MTRYCYLALAGMVGAIGLMAQIGGQRSVPVRGEISCDTSIPGTLTVEIGGNGSGPTETATVNADGSFEFRSAPPGAHELRVIGPGGGILHIENVVIHGPNQFLSIRLPSAPSPNRSAGSSISVRQLNHKVPPPAMKAFTKGEQAAAKGEYRAAAESFRQAIELDPEFADAYNELGAADAALNDLPKAAEDFQKAVDLVPDHSLALPNLAIILAKLKRYHEAGDVARRALKLAPGSCHMHYILAASLLLENGNSEEALENLQRAAEEMPKARLLAADLLSQRGRREEAIHQLEEYLRVAPPDDSSRAKAEARLAQLKQ
jgi:tetratricopeptide (TPR) repeat protein